MSFLKALNELGKGKGSRKQVLIEIYKDKIKKEKEFSKTLKYCKSKIEY
jgi:hypothetical protein